MMMTMVMIIMVIRMIIMVGVTTRNDLHCGRENGKVSTPKIRTIKPPAHN